MTDLNTIKIGSVEEFNAACVKFGVQRGERGRLPRKALAIAIMSQGVHIIGTEFLSQQDAIVASAATVSVPMVYTVEYRTARQDGSLSKVKTAVLTSQSVREATSKMSGAIGPKRLIAALAATLNVPVESIYATGEAGKMDYTSAPEETPIEITEDAAKTEEIAEIKALLEPIGEESDTRPAVLTA